MISEQLAELVGAQVDDGEDVPQGPLRYVRARVNRYWDCAPVEMLHYMVAAVDPGNSETSAFERLDDLRSRYDRDRTRHKAGSYQKSDHVECQSQLFGWPNHIEQSFKRGSQIVNRLFGCGSIADCADAWPELGRGTPDAILILLNDIGHVHVTSHLLIMHDQNKRSCLFVRDELTT